MAVDNFSVIHYNYYIIIWLCDTCKKGGGCRVRIIEYKHGAGIAPDSADIAVCLGFFDGVHLGHRALIEKTVRVARERGLVPAVFTFPQESMALKPDAARLYTTEEKLKIFASLGIELVILADFDSVSGLSPAEFVKNVLVCALRAQTALCGEDFRFGHRASGGSADLRALMAECGRDAIIHDMKYFDFPDGRVEISATLIRKYLSEGDITRATALLGEEYKLSGKVVHGRGNGKLYGYPTVNTELSDALGIRHGVYHTRVKIGGKVYTGLTNVGVCPTFGAREVHAETFILDFDGDLYESEIEIGLVEYLREERAFATKDELLREIEENIKAVREKDRQVGE